MTDTRYIACVMWWMSQPIEAVSEKFVRELSGNVYAKTRDVSLSEPRQYSNDCQRSIAASHARGNSVILSIPRALEREPLDLLGQK